jgi:hypothetical protein
MPVHGGGTDAPAEIKAAVIARGAMPMVDLDDIARGVLMLVETPSVNVQTLVIDRGRNCSRILAPAKTHCAGEGLTHSRRRLSERSAA